MKLFIDTGEGDSSSIHAGYRAPGICGSAVSLDLQLDRQEKANWCWASIAQALARYFGTGEYSQALVASGCGCADIEDSGPGELLALNRALDVVGCRHYWTPGKPSFQRLMFEINRGLPVCARIQWHSGTAHFVVIYGYELERALLVADPMDGPSAQGYEIFPTTYCGRAGVWTETYWTLEPGDVQ
jgi:hypothetical protein